MVSSSQTLKEVLIQASYNERSLSAVLEHYKNTGEKEKYEAAIFLISNLPIHESQNYKWVDGHGNTVSFSEFEYANSEEAFEILKKLKDSLKIKPLNFVEKDIEVLTTNELIENIDLAFFEWKNNPWSKTYTFKTFCEYILPYRSLVEPLNTSWRRAYKELVYNGAKNAINSNDPLEVATHAILELADYSFTNKTPDPIPLLSPLHLLFRKKGSCPDLANLSLFACRSIGLAVTFDFTPHYAASSNRHFWNTVIDSNGEHVPFNGNSYGNKNGLPSIYNPNNKRIGKVFRRTYSIQPNSLSSKTNLKNIPKGFLRSKNLEDVTHEYVNVVDIPYNFRENDTTQLAFLNVFNSSKWRVVDWAQQEEGTFVFKNVGINSVYLPGKYRNGKMYYAKYPVLLDQFKKRHLLKPNFNNVFDVDLSRDSELKNDYQDKNTLDIEEGRSYMLLYWDGKWKKIGISKATEKGVNFKGVPRNTLFRLIPRNTDGYERIFAIDEVSKKMIWY